MKKVFAASAFLMTVFIILYLAGVVDFNNTINKSLAEGNRYYLEGQYSEALASYQNGLQKAPGHQVLNYNAGQASYMLQSWQEAADYYGKADEKTDTYLNRGNAYFMAGESTEDINQKLQFYINALETYKQGIFKYPENVELKFNYEFTEQRIRDMQESMNQDQQNENESEDQQDNGQNSQDSAENQGEQQDEQQNGQQDEQQEGQQNGQQDEQSENQEQDEKDQQENGSKDNSDDEEQQDQETKQNEQDAQSGETGDDEQNRQDMPGLNDTDDSEVGEEDSRIEQILKMLEKQEEQALKNNQHIKDYGGEDEYDW